MMNSQSSRKQTMNRGSQALEIPKGKRNLKQITLRHHKKFNTACINQFHARFPLSAISGFGFRRFGSVLYAILRFILYSAIPRFILYSAIPFPRFIPTRSSKPYSAPSSVNPSSLDDSFPGVCWTLKNLCDPHRHTSWDVTDNFHVNHHFAGVSIGLLTVDLTHHCHLL